MGTYMAVPLVGRFGQGVRFGGFHADVLFMRVSGNRCNNVPLFGQKYACPQELSNVLKLQTIPRTFNFSHLGRHIFSLFGTNAYYYYYYFIKIIIISSS